MVPTADDTLTLFFQPVIMKEKVQFDHDGDSTTSVINDKVVCTIGTNDHADAIAALSRLFAGAATGGVHQDGFIVVADDLAGTYAVSEVTALSTITVTAS